MSYFCEICGKPIYGRPKTYEIGGAILILCNECAKRTRAQPIISSPRQKKVINQPRKTKARKQYLPQELETDLVENYGEKIKQARLAKKLSREELAKIVGITPSFLRRIEENTAIPPDDVIDKLEKILGIQLRERISTELELLSFDVRLKKPRSLTLADVMIIKPSKKKKKKK